MALSAAPTWSVMAGTGRMHVFMLRLPCHSMERMVREGSSLGLTVHVGAATAQDGRCHGVLKLDVSDTLGQIHICHFAMLMLCEAGYACTSRMVELVPAWSYACMCGLCDAVLECSRQMILKVASNGTGHL
jgi:hypothetical protein